MGGVYSGTSERISIDARCSDSELLTSALLPLLLPLLSKSPLAVGVPPSLPFAVADEEVLI